MTRMVISAVLVTVVATEVVASQRAGPLYENKKLNVRVRLPTGCVRQEIDVKVPPKFQGKMRQFRLLASYSLGKVDPPNEHTVSFTLGDMGEMMPRLIVHGKLLKEFVAGVKQVVPPSMKAEFLVWPWRGEEIPVVYTVGSPNGFKVQQYQAIVPLDPHNIAVYVTGYGDGRTRIQEHLRKTIDSIQGEIGYAPPGSSGQRVGPLIMKIGFWLFMAGFALYVLSRMVPTVRKKSPLDGA